MSKIINDNNAVNKIFKKQKSFDWNAENKLAEEDVKSGKVKKFKKKIAAIKWLKK
ncbi:MAG: hypothetical protein HQL25_03810 [Candidatus Omnitrophica bacterium]|nr:hypothetical protein [Candidatus Omnitrophota bacterium]